MPVVVPRYNSGQIREAPLPNARASVNAPIEAFGGGQSANAVTQASQGLAETTQKLILQEKQKADQIAVLEADSNASQLRTDLFWNAKSGVITKQGKDAFGVPDEYLKKFDDGMSSIESSLSNDDQRTAFKAKVYQYRDSFNNQIQQHVYSEGKKFDDQTTESRLSVAKNDAALNYQDPVAIVNSIETQKKTIAEFAFRNGLPDEWVKSKTSDALSKTHMGVVERMLANDNGTQARAYYYGDPKKGIEGAKSQVSGQDAITIEKQLETADNLALGVSTWNKVGKIRLSDGTPDEGKMETIVRSMSDLSDEKKEKIVAYVKARAGEEITNRAKFDQANDRQFMNTAVSARKSGTTMTEALKIADKCGIDDYDKSIKADAIRKMYSTISETDPSTFIGLWERVQNGQATSQEIDAALSGDKLNSSDWRSLREELFKGKIEGTSPIQKNAFDRVKDLADAHFSNKEKKDNFLYLIRSEAPGKSPEELIKRANDLIKDDESTKWTMPVLGWKFGGQEQWETQYQKADSNNLAMGKANEDIGRNELSAIANGVKVKGGKSFGPAELDAFAAQFGGYSKIKPGQPAHSAIQSLIKKNQLVTPANINAVLALHPDGKF